MPTLRPATAADVPVLAEVARAAFATYVPRMAGQRPAPMDADYARHVRDDETWVAEVAGEVAGHLVLVHEADAMVLEIVAVRPSAQGRGVGGALLALAEERARVAGYARITVCTNVAMVENQTMYPRAGYVETGRRTQDGYARVFYAKDLPPAPS